jgi:hypothetical protein
VGFIEGAAKGCLVSFQLTSSIWALHRAFWQH